MSAETDDLLPRAIWRVRACQFANGVAIALWFPIIITLGHESAMVKAAVGRGIWVNPWLMGAASVGVVLFAAATFDLEESEHRPVRSCAQWARYGAVLSCLGGALAVSLLMARPPGTRSPNGFSGHDLILLLSGTALIAISTLNAVVLVRDRLEVRAWVDAQPPAPLEDESA